MDFSSRDDLDSLAERTTNLIAHLDGALDATMLDAIAGVWSTIEGAAADGPTHARAVRSRLFWQSLEPAGAIAHPTPEDIVADIVDATDLHGRLDPDLAASSGPDEFDEDLYAAEAA